MKESLHLSVPTPCHQKWNSFNRTTLGGYCSSCHKEVIDFTTWDEDRIKAYFQTKPQNTCGRFRSGQLKVYDYTEPTSSKASSWFSLLIAGIVTLVSSQKSVAQSKQPASTAQHYIPGKPMETPKAAVTAIHVQGVVRFAEDSTGLPGVNVILKGTTTSTATDANGKFSLTIAKPSTNAVLQFSFIGLESVEYTLATDTSTQEINIVMDVDVTQLSEKIIVGGCYPRWYSPRRWWWGIKGLFQRG